MNGNTHTTTPADVNEHAIAAFYDEFDIDADDLDDRYTVTRWADAVADLADGDDDGVELAGAGRYAPEGIIGDYPPLWAEFHVTGAIYRAVDALNDDAVNIHLLEQFDDYTIVTVRPAVEFPSER